MKNKQFLRQLTKLEPIEFLGLARLMKIPIMREHKEDEELAPREFEEVLADMVQKYETLNRKQRRNLLKMLHPIEKEDVDG